MKKSVQKLFKGLLITTVTLLCGFGICAIFFNLFGTLTANEIKEKEFEKRHNERVEKAFREFDGLDMVKICAGSNDYAA